MRGFIIVCMLLNATRLCQSHREHCKETYVSSPRDAYRDRYDKQPNIIYIMSDDMGWNDVGFHNPKVRTPHLDSLKAKGIELMQSYTQRVCSASRAAFMTGKYPSRTGLQLLILLQETQTCLPIEHKTMFDYMKEEGYVTKYVGKWHLGYCDRSCLPEARGVDEFRGVRTGSVDYFNWTDNGVMQRQVNGVASVENIGTHLTVQDARDAREMILDHKDNPDPLFMWISPTAPHSPLQNTEEMFAVHDFLNETGEDTKKRRQFLGLVSAFDDLIGDTIAALEEAELANNTIIVFSPDNGGANPSSRFGSSDHLANNYPLRNGKWTFMEGGVRIPTIYYDPRLHPSTRGTTRNFLVHVTDWLPTFVQLARRGLKSSNFNISDIDGRSQLANLGSRYNCRRKRRYNIRHKILVDLTDATNNFGNPNPCADEDAAFRWKDYKLVYGNQYYGKDPDTIPTEWTKPQESPELPDIFGDNCHRIVNGERVVRCLFNVIDDPSETRNLYDEKPAVVARILHMIQTARQAAVKAYFRLPLPVNDTTTQPFEGFRVPRHDYCIPSMHFPLEPANPSCYQ
ncbi:arylsulfatase B-like [Watersipora subatra]|uniref:arylsulfatase B-like n=1 Tax=Watersipora subatra TaxID=2589382 RepID=UPI00355B41DA